MNYISKFFFFSSIFFFNISLSVGLGELTPVQTSPSYRVIVGHIVDSNRTNKWPIPKSVSDPFVRRCISSSLSDYTYKAPSIIGPNERWTRDDFRTYFEQLFHHDSMLAKEIHGYGVPCYEFTAAGRQKILEQLPLYAYKEFRKFVAKFPEYPQFIRNLSHQVTHNKEFCRMVNPQLQNSHEFRTSSQWQDPEIKQHKQKPVTLFCRLKQELPPKNYTPQRIDKSQNDAQQNAANKQEFIDNSQQVLQNPTACPQQKKFAQDMQNAAITTDGTCTTQKLDATPELLAAAQQQQLPKQEVEITYGDPIKHGVQKGLVACGNEAAQQKDPLSGDITNSALLGMEYNQAGFTKKALLVADLCHVALDYARKFIIFEYERTLGTVLGCVDACVNVGNMFIHPQKTIVDMAHGLAHLSYYAGKTLVELADPMFTTPVMLYGKNSYIMMLRSEDACLKREQFVSDFKQTTGIAAKEIIHTFMTTPTRDLVRKAVAFGAEGWLTTQAFLTLGSLLSKTGQLSEIVAKHIKNIAHGAEILEPVAAGVGKIEGLQPSRWQTWWNEIKDTIKDVTGIVPKITREVKHVLPHGMNLENLKQAYQTIATRFGKTLDIAYEHIFGIEDITKIKRSGLVKKEWSGFHHDYMARMEKSGVVTFANETVCPKTGIITADVSYNGFVREGKTFFPREWPPEKVIEKITEAYNNFKGSPRLDRGSWVIESMTNEGMEIKIVLTEQGKMVTAYPILTEIRP